MLQGIPQSPKQHAAVQGKSGSRFTPFTARPLVKGGNYLFEVASPGKKPTLRVVKAGGIAGAGAVRLWASGRPLRAELGKILEALQSRADDEGIDRGIRRALLNLRHKVPRVLYRGPHGEGVKWLFRQLRESGLFLESRAARFVLEGNEEAVRSLGTSDLKGMLLALKGVMGKGLPLDATAADLLGHVERGLQLIQQDQLLNLNAWKEGLGWFWFIPGHPDDGFRGGELFVKKNHPDDEEVSLSLCLEFSFLGRMDVGVSFKRPAVTVGILTDKAETAALLNSRVEELRRGMEAAGLEPGPIGCRERTRNDPPWTPFTNVAGVSGAVNVVA
jgi:hypothetical protein